MLGLICRLFRSVFARPRPAGAGPGSPPRLTPLEDRSVPTATVPVPVPGPPYTYTMLQVPAGEDGMEVLADFRIDVDFIA